MEGILASLVKKIGLSSNQLLKCVLLNTAIELFSYVDATAYSSSGYLYHEWSMEDFDHSYCAPPDTGKTLESADAPFPPLSSDRVAEAGYCLDPSVENASEEELETMYLPILENLGVQDGQVNDQLDSEPFCYLVGPINLWLELPLYIQNQSSPPSKAADACLIEETLLCFREDLSFPNVISGLNCVTQEMVVDCGVQTAEEPLTTSEKQTLDNSQMESFSISFSHGSDVMESILWDSYDLHLSRSPEEFIDKYEEEFGLLPWQGVENLYSDLFSVFNVTGETHPQKNTTRLEKQHISSTPSLDRTRSVQQSKDFLQHRLNERTG